MGEPMISVDLNKLGKRMKFLFDRGHTDSEIAKSLSLKIWKVKFLKVILGIKRQKRGEQAEQWRNARNFGNNPRRTFFIKDYMAKLKINSKKPVKYRVGKIKKNKLTLEIVNE